MARKTMALVAAILILALTSCAMPIYNVENRPVVTGSGDVPSLKQVEEAIQQAAVYKRWQIRKVKDGELDAWINVRQHFARIRIDYNTKNYSIHYAESKELLYNGTNIHRNYNKWIKLLDERIQGNLLAL